MVALWLTNIIVQLIVITTYFSRDALTLMLNLTSAMTSSPTCLWRLTGSWSKRGETYDTRPEERGRDLMMASIATVYTAFMLCRGLKFILLAAILYAPGTALIWARREQNAKVFKPSDVAIFAVVILGAVAGVYALATGLIQISTRRLFGALLWRMRVK